MPLPHYTRISNVGSPGGPGTLPDEVAYLNLFEIKFNLNLYPYELSGGQQQRVAIARALVTSPDIVLADEPTGALDSKTGAAVIDLLKNLNKEGRTIVLITHDLDIAASAPRRVFLRDGQIERDERGVS